MKYLTLLFAPIFFFLHLGYGQSGFGNTADIRNYITWVDSLADPDYTLKLHQNDSSGNITTYTDNGKLSMTDGKLKGDYRLTTTGDRKANIAYNITIEDNLEEFSIRNYYYKNNRLVYASLELQQQDNAKKVLFLAKEYYSGDSLFYRENPINNAKRKTRWRTTMNLSQNGYACLGRFINSNRQTSPTLVRRPATGFSAGAVLGNGTGYPRRSFNKYKYSVFSPGKIYYRNGDSARYRLNLNYIDETMEFYDATGNILHLKNPETIKYIIIERDTFYYEKGYLEIILQTGTARLALKKTYKTNPPGGFTNMSRMSRNGSFPGEFNSFPGQPSSGLPYYLSGFPGAASIRKEDTTYYISDTRAPFLRATKKNIANIFAERHKKIGKYFSSKKVNMNKMQDLKDLIVYISESD